MSYDVLRVYWLLVPRCIANCLVEPYASCGRGIGPENVDTFGVLGTINPKSGPTKGETWDSFGA